MPSIIRRRRTRLPTCLSMGLGAFFTMTIISKRLDLFVTAQRGAYPWVAGCRHMQCPPFGPAFLCVVCPRRGVAVNAGIPPHERRERDVGYRLRLNSISRFNHP